MDFIKIFLTFSLQVNTILCLNTSVLILKAIAIADSHYDQVSATSIVWNDDNSEDVSIFLQNYSGTVILSALCNDVINKTHEVNKYNQIILFASGKEEFKELMQILDKIIVVPIRIILVLTKIVPVTDMHIITKAAWDNDLSDLVIVSSTMGEVTLSTYFPYKGKTCGDYTSEILPMNADVFPKKFQNFYKCPTKAALIQTDPYVLYDNLTLQLTGMHANIFSVLLDRHNSSINISHLDNFFGDFINGTANGLLESLYNKKSDIVVNQAIFHSGRFKIIQQTSAFKMIYFVWIGPERRESQQWIRILRPLMNYASFAVTITFILFAAIVTVLQRKLLNISSKQNVFFKSFTIFIGLDVKLDYKSQLLNNLFMLWIFCCMIFRFVYQGNLVNGLQRTVLEKPLIELDEAIDEIGDYYSGKLMREALYNGTKYYKNMKIRSLDAEMTFIKDLVYGKRRLLLLTDSTTTKIFPNVQTIGPPRLSYPVCLIMRRGWPAAKEITTTVTRMFESGIIYKIESDYEYDWGRQKKKYRDHITRPLDMNNYVGCFYALIVMYFTCGLVFVVELIYCKLNMAMSKIKR